MFNKHLLFIVIMIVIAVGWLLFNTVSNFDYMSSSKPARFFHSNPSEIIRTSLPALILLTLITTGHESYTVELQPSNIVNVIQPIITFPVEFMRDDDLIAWFKLTSEMIEDGIVCDVNLTRAQSLINMYVREIYFITGIIHNEIWWHFLSTLDLDYYTNMTGVPSFCGGTDLGNSFCERFEMAEAVGVESHEYLDELVAYNLL